MKNVNTASLQAVGAPYMDSIVRSLLSTPPLCDQVLAAKRIATIFEGPDSNGQFFFRRHNGQLVKLTRASSAEINARRNELLGDSFRFTWPALPKGATYVEKP